MADEHWGKVGWLTPEQNSILEELRGRLPEVFKRAEEEVGQIWKGPKLFGTDLVDDFSATTVLLLKFLRAEEFKIDKAEERIVKTLIWRAECQVDDLRDADLPAHFQGHDVIGGTDVDGRALFVSRFGKMDLQAVFGDVEAFVRYRVKFMELAVQKLTFAPGQAEDLCQIHDYSGVPLVFQQATVKECVNVISKVFADHYPEFKGKTVFVNFPKAFATLFGAFSVFMPERTKKKFCILAEGDHQGLFEHVPPEHVSVELGGAYSSASRAWKAKCNAEKVPQWSSRSFDGVEVEGPATIAWEGRVCYQDVDITVVFVTRSKTEVSVCSTKRVTADDGLVSGEFSAAEAGTLQFRFGNAFSWMSPKVVLYRAEVV